MKTCDDEQDILETYGIIVNKLMSCFALWIIKPLIVKQIYFCPHTTYNCQKNVEGSLMRFGDVSQVEGFIRMSLGNVERF